MKKLAKRLCSVTVALVMIFSVMGTAAAVEYAGDVLHALTADAGLPVMLEDSYEIADSLGGDGSTESGEVPPSAEQPRNCMYCEDCVYCEDCIYCECVNCVNRKDTPSDDCSEQCPNAGSEPEAEKETPEQPSEPEETEPELELPAEPEAPEAEPELPPEPEFEPPQWEDYCIEQILHNGWWFDYLQGAEQEPAEPEFELPQWVEDIWLEAPLEEEDAEEEPEELYPLEDEEEEDEKEEPEESESADALLQLSLPSAVPFELQLFGNSGKGVVSSEDFQIANHGGGTVFVTLDEVLVTIADTRGFALVSEEQLPEYGNNLHMVIIFTQGDESVSYVLAVGAPAKHTFVIENGESASFRFAGIVNQFGERAWSDNTVTASMRISAGMVVDYSEDEAETEPSEEDEPGFGYEQDDLLTDGCGAESGASIEGGYEDSVNNSPDCIEGANAGEEVIKDAAGTDLEVTLPVKSGDDIAETGESGSSFEVGNTSGGDMQSAVP